MFFEISKKKNKNYPLQFKLTKEYFLNIDHGWKTSIINNITYYYKGYCDNMEINHSFFKKITNEEIPTLDGNFTIIFFCNDQIIITHDRCRSYPIYIDEEKIILTNLINDGKKIYSDEQLILNVSTSKILKKKIKFREISQKKLNFFETIDSIDQLLNKNIQYFIKNNNHPIKIIITGGLDSLLLYSYVKKFTNNFEIIDYEYKKWTQFSKLNRDKIEETSIAFKKSHSWGYDDVVMMSGFSGDQFFVRDISQTMLLIKNLKKNFQDYKKEFKNSYSYDYFYHSKDFAFFSKNLNEKKYKIISTDIEKTKEYCMLSLSNCCTLWHNDCTMYFTPFRNLKIPNLICDLDSKEIIENAFNCTIQKKLIERNDKKLLNFISQKKNLNHYQKVIDFLNFTKKSGYN